MATPQVALVPNHAAVIEPAPPAPEHRIYVNRNLRLDTIKAIGFDMDYTLARYRRLELEQLAHRLTLEKLIARGYPEELRTLTYDPRFVIRGLVVDKQTGNILKLDRHDHVGRAFSGRRRLTKRERIRTYRRERLEFIPPRFALVDTLFSLPEMCLYADMVEWFRSRRDHKLDTWTLFEDTRECIDEAHRDESLKSIVKAEIARYVEKDPLLARTLHKLRSSGKVLFLLTNSHWNYTDCLMRFLLDGELAEYPTWRHYFEVIIVGSHKPDFFKSKEPFAEIDAQGTIVRRPALRFERGKVYQGGNLKSFEQALGPHGDDILYVGDHIYGDILRSKKSSLWRTALVVEELEDETQTMRRHTDDLKRMAELENERRRLDDLANLQRRKLAQKESQLGATARHNPDYIALREARDQTKVRFKNVIRELSRLQAVIDRAFNPNWGMVFKEDNENSRFGEQVGEYACIYTSRVTNFFHYSAYQYFRSPRDLMPHERDLF